jgi:hypothetical protein
MLVVVALLLVPLLFELFFQQDGLMKFREESEGGSFSKSFSCLIEIELELGNISFLKSGYCDRKQFL